MTPEDKYQWGGAMARLGSTGAHVGFCFTSLWRCVESTRRAGAQRSREGYVFSAFGVEVFPCSFVAFEAGAFVEFVGLTLGKIMGDEFDLTDFVVRAALGHHDDGEEAPICLMDGLIEVRLQVRFAGVWVGSGDEVIGEPEEVGTVAGAHELQGGVGFGLAEVEGLAAGGIGFAAFARA